MNAREKARELTKLELLREAKNLFFGDGNDVFSLEVRRLFPNLSQAFVLYCLPEQAEDIYWLLVSSTDIAKIEIPRHLNDGKGITSIEMTSVEAYRHRRLSRDARQKLEVALEIIAAP
jgi:hypothetical protein